MFLHTYIFYIQIYLISAITLFALPNISVHFTGFFLHITMPFILPVAHIGMVNKYIQGVSKKTGISVQGSFNALNWPKIKKSKKTNPT